MNQKEIKTMAQIVHHHFADAALRIAHGIWNMVCTAAVAVPETLVAWQERSETRAGSMISMTACCAIWASIAQSPTKRHAGLSGRPERVWRACSRECFPESL